MSKNITAIVPTRAGSERLKNKNIRPFADKSLLQIKIDILKVLIEKGHIQKIVVNTNCKKSMEIAYANNIDVVKRDEYYASSECPINEYWNEVLMNGVETEASMLCQVTSPLIKLETFEKCIINFNELGSPIMTVDYIKDYLWKADKNKFHAVNYDYPNHPKSQDLEKNFFRINFGVVIITKSDLLKYKNIMTPKTHCIYLNREECIDIDDGIDFRLAESIYLKSLK